jgi:DNA-binding CsgD family transcriptional regulator
MTQLSRVDLEQVVGISGEMAELESDEAYSPEVLARLRELIRCDAITYQEVEHETRRSRLVISLQQEGDAYRWEASTAEPSTADDELYWRVGPCPIVHHRIRERDLGALRMSDVISLRRFRELPVYHEYFQPWGMCHMLDLGLPARWPRQRSLILFRAEDSRDFSERDRTVLELLRQHFHGLETSAALRGQLVEAIRRGQLDDLHAPADGLLTTREREIVELVAEGKTNAEIAARLWVAPSTVKKHLEHVYAKGGVGRRAAAVTLLRPVHRTGAPGEALHEAAR